MKPKLNLATAVALALTQATDLVHAQGGQMMNGGWYGGAMGGYGGLWIPILVAVIVGLLVWIVTQRRK